MKKYVLNTLIFTLFVNLSFSQNLDSLNISRINDTILSKYLNEKRSIEIQLPRSYDVDLDKKYPLMIVLDGDYAKAGTKIRDYVYQTSLITPYATITFDDPKGEKFHHKSIIRSMPPAPTVIAPHPYLSLIHI